MNPLSRLLAGIVAALALAGAFFFGIFVFAIALGLGLIAWLALWLRIWWIRRRLTRGGVASGTAKGGSPNAAARDGDVIDAEYEVVSREEDD